MPKDCVYEAMLFAGSLHIFAPGFLNYILAGGFIHVLSMTFDLFHPQPFASFASSTSKFERTREQSLFAPDTASSCILRPAFRFPPRFVGSLPDGSDCCELQPHIRFPPRLSLHSVCWQLQGCRVVCCAYNTRGFGRLELVFLLSLSKYVGARP